MAKSVSSKVRYRCLKDNFAYCAGTPNFAGHGTEFTLKDMDGKPSSTMLVGAICSSDPKTCRKYLTLSQTVAKTKED